MSNCSFYKTMPQKAPQLEQPHCLIHTPKHFNFLLSFSVNALAETAYVPVCVTLRFIKLLHCMLADDKAHKNINSLAV